MLPSVAITPAPLNWVAPEDRYTNAGEYERLLALANKVNASSVLEIGCNTGITSKMLLDNCPTIKRYVGVDVPVGTQLSLAAQKNEVPAVPGKWVVADPRFELLLSPKGSMDLHPNALGKFDMVFIDGDHSIDGVVNDTLLAYLVTNRPGIVVWHDYHHLGTVDVPFVLDKFSQRGHSIQHVSGTWLAFEELE